MSLIIVGRWLRRRAEDVAVLLLMGMFLAFIIQILFRYVFSWPLGWTSEFSILCWLWVVLWGAAFVTAERDEIRFDVVYSLLSDKTRRRLTVVTGVALVVIYCLSLPAVVEYVRFMRVERTSYLKIPFDLAYCVYVIFAVAAIGRYAWLTWQALRGASAPETLLDSTQSGPSA
jgi:TRAP-type C4-dicarboxylate transport system permease small subunit